MAAREMILGGMNGLGGGEDELDLRCIWLRMMAGYPEGGILEAAGNKGGCSNWAWEASEKDDHCICGNGWIVAPWDMKEKCLGCWLVISRFRDDPCKKGRICNGPEQRMERCESISRDPREAVAKDLTNQKKSFGLTLQKLILVLEGTDLMKTVCRSIKERMRSM